MPKGNREHRVNTKLAEACRECTLPICNDKAAGCAYMQIMKVWEGRDYERRKAYHTNYYAINRERKLAAANERNANKRAMRPVQ